MQNPTATVELSGNLKRNTLLLQAYVRKWIGPLFGLGRGKIFTRAEGGVATRRGAVGRVHTGGDPKPGSGGILARRKLPRGLRARVLGSPFKRTVARVKAHKKSQRQKGPAS